jgi:hypothetical protein
MPQEDRKVKSFKFVGGAKYERTGKWLACPRKGQFRAHTLVSNEPNPNFASSNPSINYNCPKEPSSAQNTQNTQNTQLNKSSRQNSEDSNLQIATLLPQQSPNNQKNNKVNELKTFIYQSYNSIQQFINNYDILQVLGIETQEINFFHAIRQNFRQFTLQFPSALPLFTGSSPEINITEFNSSKLEFFNQVFPDEFNDPLQAHLIKLYFKYFNPYCTIVHPLFFQYRLKHHFNHPDFQSLLSIILSLASKYLAVEPYQSSIDVVEYSQYHFDRSNRLIQTIEEKEDLPALTKIQILLISNHFDFRRISVNLDTCWKLVDKLGWNSKFTRSPEEINATRPSNPIVCRFEEWQQELLVWCALVFYSSLATTMQFPIKKFKFIQPFPSIQSALKSLLTCSDQSEWTNTIDAKHSFLLYSASRLLNKVRIFNNRTLDRYPLGCTQTQELKNETTQLKDKITQLKNLIDQFYPSADLPSPELSVVSSLAIFYMGIELIMNIPFLPSESTHLQNCPSYLRSSEEFVKLAAKISLLATCQSTWASVYTAGPINYMLSISWAGVSHLQSIYIPQSIPPDYNMNNLITLLPSLSQTILEQLRNNFCFRYHKQFTLDHCRHAAGTIWLGFRRDPGMVNIVDSLRPSL